MSVFDKILDDRLSRNKNLSVSWYLMASYLYYHRAESLLSDCRYDVLCKQILEWWDEIDHRHKYLLDRDSLKAGTGFYLREQDYPNIAIDAACFNMGIPDLRFIA